jgi:FAD:protein FMN transferase
MHKSPPIHLLACLLLGSLLLLLTACSEGPLLRQESFVFGTRVEVVSFGAPDAQAQAAIASVLREFDRLHRDFHAWQPSPLTTLNQALASGETPTVNAEMAGLLATSRSYAERSDYLFDPAIGGLIQLWGFHSDSYVPRLPDPQALQQWLSNRPSMADLNLSGNTVSSRNPAVRIDLGGIAKGYALDRAAAILHAAGVHNALINIGGNVMALGSKGKHPWTVGIQDPRGSGAIATLALYDGEAIGTSGDYQRFFELDGQRYSHLLDPRTGRPATQTQAVTVLITPRPKAGLLSDVTSKPVFLAGTAWREMARRFELEHVLRVDADGAIQITAGMRERLRWRDNAPAAQVVE